MLTRLVLTVFAFFFSWHLAQYIKIVGQNSGVSDFTTQMTILGLALTVAIAFGCWANKLTER